jgi:hypothetical protein
MSCLETIGTLEQSIIYSDHYSMQGNLIIENGEVCWERLTCIGKMKEHINIKFISLSLLSRAGSQSERLKVIFQYWFYTFIV